MKLRRFLSCMMALLLVCSLPLAAFADTWYLEDGDITVNATESGQTVTQGSGDAVADNAPVITQKDSSTPTSSTITINAAENTTANVTLDGVNIDTGTSGGAAIQITGNGDVIIELDGSNSVQSGYCHAGVEKNNGGNLTITDTDPDAPGSVNAIGGECGSGIGGGFDGSGSDITIAGSAEVTAQGGYGGSGIGGGALGSGRNITIEGNAEVAAKGGVNGSGIGGGYFGSGSNITISEDAQVKAQGGEVFQEIDPYYYYGAGAAIGDGGKPDADGQNVTPTTNDLNEGWIATYAPGTTDLDTAAPDTLTYKGESGVTTSTKVQFVPSKDPTCEDDGNTAGFQTESDQIDIVTIPATGHSFTNYISDNNATYDHDGTKTAKCDHPGCDATDTITDPGTRLPAPLYRVVGKDGKGVSCGTERKDGVLTITVDEDFASLTGHLWGIQTLQAQGIDTIVFVTNGAASTFALADLLATMTAGDSYTLTHDGSTVTFTLATGTDISGVLK